MSPRRDLVIILFMLGVFLLVSPFTLWWMEQSRFWLLPYLFWLVVIVLTAILSSRQSE